MLVVENMMLFALILSCVPIGYDFCGYRLDDEFCKVAGSLAGNHVGISRLRATRFEMVVSDQNGAIDLP